MLKEGCVDSTLLNPLCDGWLRRSSFRFFLRMAGVSDALSGSSLRSPPGAGASVSLRCPRRNELGMTRMPYLESRSTTEPCLTSPPRRRWWWESAWRTAGAHPLASRSTSSALLSYMPLDCVTVLHPEISLSDCKLTDLLEPCRLSSEGKGFRNR